MATARPSISDVLQGQVVALSEEDYILESKHMFIPRTKYNMCYIVSSVLLNEEGKVLLIQEAKRSCRGTWYLPAGRVEAGETFLEAAHREVEEETGLKCEVGTLLCVETTMTTWVRVNFAAVATGGKLKTTEEADEESLQAQWFTREELTHTNLRAKDILPLIDHAIAYQKAAVESKHPVCVPHIIAHTHITFICVLFCRVQNGSEEEQMYILRHCKTKDRKGFPAVIVSHNEFHNAQTISRLLRKCMKSSFEVRCNNICGLLSIEHDGRSKEADGSNITLLVEYDTTQGTEKSSKLKLPTLASNFEWCQISQSEIDMVKLKTVTLGCVGFWQR